MTNLQERITKLGNMIKALGIKTDIIQIGTYGIFISHNKLSSSGLNKILRATAKRLNQENINSWVTSTKLNDNSKVFIFSYIGEAQAFEVTQIIRELKAQA